MGCQKTIASDYTFMVVVDISNVSENRSNFVDVQSGRLIFANTAGENNPGFFNGSAWVGPNVAQTGKVLIEYVAASPSVKIYRDGAEVFSDANGYPTRFAFNGSFGIGAHHSTALSYFEGSIAEIIIVPSGLDTSDRRKMEGYLAHKWGLAANLPTDHKTFYRNFTPQQFRTRVHTGVQTTPLVRHGQDAQQVWSHREGVR